MDQEYCTSIGAIAEAALLAQQLTELSDTKAAVPNPAHARAT
jgi:hypothetical protein